MIITLVKDDPSVDGPERGGLEATWQAFAVV